ncbi:L-glutamate gamma-semialdehyde dehydrogenase [Halobacillus kuroshimensis]|uniref:L-glutamate gamma-semialdehyde dehydrogenase n=1 Tax=Halobacillus kuroshimensis TaxID=302481 RepID=A0ABS3DY99_9BACI|nr:MULTISPECIES: L-glutamate gamma-semialdehyde dehydrogenase [Halobacillus]MBN8236312.1 L-glutamate gamma-semialdehyde dehydrogenase [Halobacillus kuroshimensis]
MVQPYKHEPFTDFEQQEHKKAFEDALKQVKEQLGQHHDLLINGERVRTDDTITSTNPANTKQVVGTISKANQELAEKAVQSASDAFEDWRKWDPRARAEILFRAASKIRRRKHEFSSYLVYEVGKPWKEADADTAEAIDFLEYYGRQMIELKEGKAIESRPGEENRYVYQPIGVTVVIPPWNLALAIMAGTTVAPLVAGNTVVMKPASNSAVIAAKFVEVLEESGLPKGVLNFVPGSGGEVGDYLVDHPKTALISFTGSRDVGLRIMERASVRQPGQNHLKQVIAEMGGKDTVVVDKEADIDTAVDAIVVSAFGFSGQKCSSGSRAVVHEDVYDEVLEKVKAATEKLTVGNASEENVYMGPVVDQGAYDKIMSYMEIGKEEGRLVTGGKGDDSKGYFINPTIFADLDPNSRMQQEEIFGPVVCFTKAKDFDEAIDIANNTEYGLTGAVISDNRAHLEKAKYDFHVGNLYFNRNCTGAIVGYQPFGGFKMSGTDSKAGGPDYIALHMQAKTISEKF